MTANEIRKKYIEFFCLKGHKQIPSAPLIPEHDPTVLFTTAGMHPLVPYLMGEAHPQGARLVNFQKCIRTDDIEEVGDETHNTFFEMLGNWSLGDYFKKEAIEWSLEFLTSSKWLGLDINKIAISVFAGDKNAPQDKESARIWQNLGIPKSRIAYLGKKDNWWGPAGKTGPCGPDTEMFYWVGGNRPPKKFNPNDDQWVEIWNNVFMEYERKVKAQISNLKTKSQNSKLNDDVKYEYVPLKQKNVDTGMGLERITAIMQGKKSIYETELFAPIIKKIKSLIPMESIVSSRASADVRIRAIRIIADHIRAAVFILGDQYGIAPSNLGQGYVLRKLIRRAIRFAGFLNIRENILTDLAKIVVQNFKNVYPELYKNQKFIYQQLTEEEAKFKRTLDKGLREFAKVYYFDLYKMILRKLSELYPNGNLPIQIKTEQTPSDVVRNLLYYLSASQDLKAQMGVKMRQALERELNRREVFIESVLGYSPVIKQEFYQKFSQLAFKLYDTYGFPYEITQEMAKEHGVRLNLKIFKQAFAKHQEMSRRGAQAKFAGGLADQTYATKKLHTATHLLQQALRKVLGDHIEQRGSNITKDRLRFDFSHPRALSLEEIKQVETLVNQKIKQALPVKVKEMSLEQARQVGAIGLFPEKYHAKVKVYSIGAFSREICGGPHVENTKELGSFKIIKQESSSAGVRRIKAVLQ